MSQNRKTRSPVYVRLPENRIKQIESLVADWNFETSLFVLRRLHQYDPKRGLFDYLTGWLRGWFRQEERSFQFLRNPELLSDWRRRIEVSGSRNAAATWNRILSRELTWHDYHYLRFLLEQQTTDIHVPADFLEIFRKLYHAHILKEYTEDSGVPRAPLVLVIGGSGSGKSATVKEALEAGGLRLGSTAGHRPAGEAQGNSRQRAVLAQPGGCRSGAGGARWSDSARRSGCAFSPACRSSNTSSAQRVAHALSTLEEEGVQVDYAMITPNDYQTAWAGEPGNYLRKAMGDPRRTSIRHLEEAHSAFGRPDQMSTVKGQQNTLVDAANILLDEIAYGRRDCLLIATTDQPEQFDPAIYRRFVERGTDPRHQRTVGRPRQSARGGAHGAAPPQPAAGGAGRRGHGCGGGAALSDFSRAQPAHHPRLCAPADRFDHRPERGFPHRAIWTISFWCATP